MTNVRSVPSRAATSAIRGAASATPTPMSARVAPAGLVSGPSRLNAVRTPISRRVGPAWRIAGWNVWREQEREAVLGERAASALAASWSIRTPSASSTSAEPAWDVIARLPCFATGIPAAATTSAAVVEMLNVPEPSPPVPTTSIAPSGASTRVDPLAHRAREAGQLVDGLAAHPEAHEQRRELRRRRLAVHDLAHREARLVDGQRPPVDDRRERRADLLAHRATSSGASSARGRRGQRVTGGLGRHRHAPRRERPGRRIEPRRLALPGEPEEVREQVRAVGREHALGVELDALDRQRAVAEAHDDAVLGARGADVQVGGERRRVDHQRVVARGRERLGHALEQAGAVVDDLGRLAVDERRRADDRGAVGRRPSTASRGTRRAAGSAGRRRSGRCRPTRRRVPGSPGPGEITMPRRSAAGSAASAAISSRGDLVVAHDAHVRPGGLERLHEVERERVVVVDHQDHRGAASGSAPRRRPACERRPWRRRRDRELDRPAHRGGLVLGLLELELGHAPGDDPRAGVDVRLAALQDGGPDRDRRVEVAVVAEIAHRPTIQPAPLALGRGDQLHRADLRRPGQRARGEHGAERVERVELRAELRLDVAHEVEDVAVALDLHVLAGGHGARPRDPPEVVPPEVDEHHVLGTLLGVVAQLVGEPVVVGRRRAARAGAGDRVGRHPVARRPGRGAPGWRRRPPSPACG